MTSDHLHDRPSFRLRWPEVIAIYVCLTLAYCWPLLPGLSTTFPSDPGDPALVSWGLWWNTQAWPLTEKWWNAAIFVPMPGAFSLSETFLGLVPITSPIVWAGGSPALAHNIVFLLSFPTAALAAHALAYRLTGRHAAALIAGAAFGFSPYRASQMPHLHLLVTCWMPLGLLALHRFVDERRPRDLALFAVCWLFNGLTTGYYLFFFAVLVGVWMLWFVKRWRDWLGIALAAGLATAPLAPVLMGYGHYQRLLGMSRTPEEIQLFSADLTGIASVSPHAWLPHHWSLAPGPEGELYPGLMVLLLAILGGVAAWRATPRRGWPWLQRGLFVAGVLVSVGIAVALTFGGWQLSVGGMHLSFTRPHRAMASAFWLLVLTLLCSRRLRALWMNRSAAFFYLAAGVLMLCFAFGPMAYAFGKPVLFRAPYWLLTLMPGGNSLRVPARFAMLFMLCLAQAGALAVAGLKSVRARRILIPLGVVVILAEGWVPKMTIVPVPETIDLAGIDPSVRVLELPVGPVFSETATLYRATVHGHPLVNGYSGYVPAHYYVLSTALRARDVSILPMLRETGPLAVIVQRDAESSDRYAALVSDVPGAKMVARSSVGRVFLLPPQPAPSPRTDVGVRLTPRSVVANVNNDIAPLMIDGDITTLWGSPKAQEAGEEVTVTFDAPATFARVVLQTGDPVLDYPRLLRISVTDESGARRAVWEGRTAGLAVQGVLRDRFHAPVQIDLPDGVRGTQLTFTLLEGDDEIPWAISEVQVFGKTGSP